MNIIDRFNHMNPKLRSVTIILSLIFIGIIVGYIIATVSSPYLIERIEHPPHHFFPKNRGQNGNNSVEPVNLTDEQKNNIVRGYSFAVIILTVEITLLIGLIIIYIDIFTKTNAKYIIGFLLFVSVFLVKSLSQLLTMTPVFTEVIREAPTAINPLLRSNFGPFGIFFTIFEIVALCILLYISSE